VRAVPVHALSRWNSIVQLVSHIVPPSAGKTRCQRGSGVSMPVQRKRTRMGQPFHSIRRSR